MFSPPLRSVDYYFAMLRSFLTGFLSCFLGGDMMIYHQEDKQPNIRLDVYIQADMRMLRFKSQDYIVSFSIIMKFKGKLAPLYGKQF